MSDKPETTAPEQSPEDKAYMQLQGRLTGVLGDECRTAVRRYVAIYGMDFESATWGLFSAVLTTLDQAHPGNQKALMEGLLRHMNKRIAALSGQPPAPKAAAEEEVQHQPV